MCNKDENEGGTIGDFDKQRNQFKRSPNWSDIEIETLCNFVREHKQNLFMQTGAQKKANANKAKHWELAANEINAIACTQRHWRQVRKKWKDLVYYTKNCNKKAVISNETVEMCDKVNDNLQQGVSTSLSSIDVIDTTGNIMTSNSSDTSYSTTTSDLSPVSTPKSSDASWKEEPDCIIPRACNSATKSALPKCPPSYSILSQKMSPTHAFERRRVCEKQDNFNSDIFPALNQYRLTTKRQKISDSGNPRNKGLQESSMSAYERARLQIEEEKLAVQKNTLNYLHSMCKGMQRVTTAISKLKRKRKSSKSGPLVKRAHYVRSWTPATHSDDTSGDDFL